MSHQQQSAQSSDSPFAIQIPSGVLTRLSEGNLGAEEQRALVNHLSGENVRLVQLGSGANTPLSHLMDVDSSTVAPGNNNLNLPGGRGRRLQILTCTRNMKTLAKNTIEKLARLRLRLVKLGEADSHEKQKQYFQFRLVQVEDIDKDNKKELDGKVGSAVAEVLTKDIQDLVTALESEQKELGARLKQELTDAAEAAFAKASADSVAQVKALWGDLITYNVRWFAEELVKFEAGLTTKVFMKALPSSEQINIRVNLNVLLTNVYIIIANLCADYSDLDFEKTQIEEEFGQKPNQTQPKETSRSFLRRQKRQQKKKEGPAKKGQTSGKTVGCKPDTVAHKGGQSVAAETRARKEKAQETAAKKSTKRRSAAKKEVFVNVALADKSLNIPAYVFRMLNLGANYQLCQFPKQQETQREWQKTTTQVAALLGNSGSFFRKNVYESVVRSITNECIYNETYLNKTIFKNRHFKMIARNNALINKCFSFLVDNNLCCILADKNLGLTIVSKDWYDAEMRKHFNRSELFTERTVPSLEDIRRESVNLQTMLRTRINYKNVVYSHVSEVFDANATVIPQAYGLIKLHKVPHKLRYITPVVNWINVKAAKFVVDKLQPYLVELPHVLQNSMSLCRDLAGMRLQSHCIMSYDVEDMYNSVDQVDCIHMLKQLAKKRGWWPAGVFNDVKWEKILITIEWVFTTSLVGYGDKCYKQKRGLPMGSPLSPVLANLYMAAIEESILFDKTFSDIIYVRFLDDILMWSVDNEVTYDEWASDPCVHPAQEYMETIVDLIQFESAGSLNLEKTGSAQHVEELVEFLDLELWIAKWQENSYGRFQYLETKVYDKPTNLHIYTDPSTFYPMHYVYNWIQGENIRLIRNSSTEEAYKHSVNKFREFLFRRNYCEDKVNHFIALNYFEDRTDLLQGRKPHKLRKGLGNDINNNRSVIVANSGSRPLITKAVRIMNNLLSTLKVTDTGLSPVVTKGNSIITKMNKTRKTVG